LKLAAPTESALKGLARNLKDHLELNPTLNIGDVCFTLNTGRNDFDHRLWVSAESLESLKEKLTYFVEGKAPEGLRSSHLQIRKSPKVAFLFTGQGSQYAGMARELYKTEPDFRKIVDRGDEVLREVWESEGKVRSQESGVRSQPFTLCTSPKNL